VFANTRKGTAAETLVRDRLYKGGQKN